MPWHAWRYWRLWSKPHEIIDYDDPLYLHPIGNIIGTIISFDLAGTEDFLDKVLWLELYRLGTHKVLLMQVLLTLKMILLKILNWKGVILLCVHGFLDLFRYPSMQDMHTLKILLTYGLSCVRPITRLMALLFLTFIGELVISYKVVCVNLYIITNWMLYGKNFIKLRVTFFWWISFLQLKILYRLCPQKSLIRKMVLLLQINTTRLHLFPVLVILKGTQPKLMIKMLLNSAKIMVQKVTL